MMRSLWTGASGMIAQQNNVDLISNNLANVNTFAYKKERMEFKTLLYQTMKRADMDPALQSGAPVNLQVGLGVRPIASTRFFDMGNVQVTGGKLDFALQGDGFFKIDRGNRPGEISQAYTRDGALKLSVVDEGSILVTSDGFHVLDANDEAIIFPPEVMLSAINVNYNGTLSYIDGDNNVVEMDPPHTIAVYQFSNVQGLEAIGNNLYIPTAPSGQAVLERDNDGVATGDTYSLTDVLQGTVEMSNVQVAEEMVRLIVAQRAYELNSKVITTSDDMLAQANNLKR